MSRHGWVLAGGLSSRMGRNKALLPYCGRTLAQYVAEVVAEAAGGVTLVGDPQVLAGLGLPVIQDSVSGAGPLGGILTALEAEKADWNLVVACDMPGVTAGFLGSLLEEVESSQADCLIPLLNGVLAEPLCAAYHRRCLSVVRASVDAGVRKVTEGLAGLRIKRRLVEEVSFFQNVNTPEEWSRVLDG